MIRLVALFVLAKAVTVLKTIVLIAHVTVAVVFNNFVTVVIVGQVTVLKPAVSNVSVVYLGPVMPTPSSLVIKTSARIASVLKDIAARTSVKIAHAVLVIVTRQVV